MINPTVGPIKKQSPKKNTSKTISHHIPLFAPKSPKESKEMKPFGTTSREVCNQFFLMETPKRRRLEKFGVKSLPH